MTDQELREKALDQARRIVSFGEQQSEQVQVFADALLRWRAEGQAAEREALTEIVRGHLVFSDFSVNCCEFDHGGRYGCVETILDAIRARGGRGE